HHFQKCNSLTCSYEALGPLLKRVMRMSLHYIHLVDISNLVMKAPLTLGGVPPQGRRLDWTMTRCHHIGLRLVGVFLPVNVNGSRSSLNLSLSLRHSLRPC